MTAVAIPKTSERVVLVDLSSLYWTAYHATAKESASDAKNLTLATIRRIQSEYPGLIAICCDSGKSFRHELNPEYKAGRAEKTKASLEELDRTVDRLRADGYLLWTAKGFEADDIIATATQCARAAGHDVMIASADKDLQQLVGGGVRQLRTHVWKEGGADAVRETFGVGPSQVRDWLALTGDASDNIKGCPGCGPKKATALLAKFTNLEGLYTTLKVNDKAVAEALGSTNAKPWDLKIIQDLKASEATVMLARQLVELRRDVPIRWEEIYEERKVMPLTTFEQEPPREPGSDDGEEQVAAAPAAESETVSIGELVTMPAPKPEPEARLATVPQAFDRQLEPSSLKEAFWLAQGMWESRLYQKFGSPHAIWAAMIRGREMGFPALTSLDLFHVIEGKPSLSANAIQSLAEKHPDCEFFRPLHSDAQYAEWETKNRKHPEPTKHRYSAQDAVDAGLCGLEVIPRADLKQKDQRSNWDKRRSEMLRKTAAVQLIRMIYPSAAIGLYAIEELSDRDVD